MYNGMFGLYVDFEENRIKIVDQENIYFPQHRRYDMDENMGYVAVEHMLKFMSLHDMAPDIVYNEDNKKFEFEPTKNEKSCPVQIFYRDKQHSVSYVDTKGRITFKKLDFNSALVFANRPSDILTQEFVADVFRKGV